MYPIKSNGIFSLRNLCQYYSIDANNMQREKARQELHKNVTNYFDQILAVTSDETTAVLPFTYHLKNHTSKTTKRYETQLEK